MYEWDISGDKLLHIILKTCQYPKISIMKKIALTGSNIWMCIWDMRISFAAVVFMFVGLNVMYCKNIAGLLKCLQILMWEGLRMDLSILCTKRKEWKQERKIMYCVILKMPIFFTGTFYFCANSFLEYMWNISTHICVFYACLLMVFVVNNVLHV